MNVSDGRNGGERGSNPQKWAEGLGKSGGKGSNWQVTPSLAMLPLCGTIVWGNVAKRLLPAGCSLWGWLSQALREIFGGYWNAPLPLFNQTDTIQSLIHSFNFTSIYKTPHFSDLHQNKVSDNGIYQCNFLFSVLYYYRSTLLTSYFYLTYIVLLVSYL